MFGKVCRSTVKEVWKRNHNLEKDMLLIKENMIFVREQETWFNIIFVTEQGTWFSNNF